MCPSGCCVNGKQVYKYVTFHNSWNWNLDISNKQVDVQENGIDNIYSIANIGNIIKVVQQVCLCKRKEKPRLLRHHRQRYSVQLLMKHTGSISEPQNFNKLCHSQQARKHVFKKLQTLVSNYIELDDTDSAEFDAIVK
jgi:hypothetical protein